MEIQSLFYVLTLCLEMGKILRILPLPPSSLPRPSAPVLPPLSVYLYVRLERNYKIVELFTTNYLLFAVGIPADLQGFSSAFSD